MTPPPSTLLLIPTAREREGLDPGATPGLDVELCGFGPVAAAARAAALLAAHRPARVILAGIAGTYAPEALPQGSATTFGRVALDGVGAGEGAAALGPRDLGLPQWPGDERIEAVHDTLDLDPSGTRRLLLTVCSASGTASEADRRRARWPGVLAEDMEGFGVALACRLADVPLTIVRGISNLAGDRERRNWSVGAAFQAASEELSHLLGPRA